jgi:hypothetical protein
MTAIAPSVREFLGPWRDTAEALAGDVDDSDET